MAEPMPMPMRPPGAPPSGGPPPGGPLPGPTGPATTGAPNAGLKMRGSVLATLAIKLLTEALRLVGPTSDEGRDVLRSLTTLTKRFGDASGDLTRQEAKLLTERAAPVSAPNPQQAEQFKQMVAGKLQGMGIGGPPPGGAAAA